MLYTTRKLHIQKIMRKRNLKNTKCIYLQNAFTDHILFSHTPEQRRRRYARSPFTIHTYQFYFNLFQQANDARNTNEKHILNHLVVTLRWTHRHRDQRANGRGSNIDEQTVFAHVARHIKHICRDRDRDTWETSMRKTQQKNDGRAQPHIQFKYLILDLHTIH